MKRENLTWQKLWPLVGDGQCFDYQNMEGERAFQFVGGQLFFYSLGNWKAHCSQLDTVCYFKLVDDPSQPKQQDEHLQQELEDNANKIFSQLETPYIDGSDGAKAAKKDCAKALISMFEALRADLLREIEEKTK
jgi:hypothetical protein